MIFNKIPLRPKSFLIIKRFVILVAGPRVKKIKAPPKLKPWPTRAAAMGVEAAAQI